MDTNVEIIIDFRSLISDDDLLEQETNNLIRQLTNLNEVNEVNRVRDENLPDGAMSGSGKSVKGIVRGLLNLIGVEPYIELVYNVLKIYYGDKDKFIVVDIYLPNNTQFTKITIRSENDFSDALDLIRSIESNRQLLSSDDTSI